MNANRRRTRAGSMSVVLLAALSVAAAIFLFSCTPGSELTASESNVVVTAYDPNVNFGTIVTYAMPDTIIHIVDEGKEDNISREYDQAILDLLAANFNARGFTRVDEDAVEPPDALVLVSVTTTDYWNYYSYYGGWWDWYGGWGWWGYYPCCWGYPPPAWGVSYAYTTGTLLVDMVDPGEQDPENDLIAAYWRGVANGILSGGKTAIANRFGNSINQMFIQSPYLKSAGQPD